LSGSGALWSQTAPGFVYENRHSSALNLVGGAGYFLTSSLELGADVAFTLYGGDKTQWLTALAPFLRLVTGMERERLGFFVEFSPAYVFVDRGHGDTGHFLELTAWPGVHVPLNRSVAFVAGPSFTFVERLDAGQPSGALIGLRAGLSVYLPSNDGNAAPAASPRKHGKGTVELRFQTATNAPTGGRLAPGATTNNVTYSTHSQELLANSILGAGVFVSPEFEFGGEAMSAYLYLSKSKEAINPFGLALFGKFVQGMREFKAGFFAEFSPGLLGYTVYNGTQYGLLAQENLWAGGHFPVGSSLAFVVGPALTRIDQLAPSAGGYFIAGLRFGMSVYFPPHRRQSP
jgi:hypothetical protein